MPVRRPMPEPARPLSGCTSPSRCSAQLRRACRRRRRRRPAARRAARARRRRRCRRCWNVLAGRRLHRPSSRSLSTGVISAALERRHRGDRLERRARSDKAAAIARLNSGAPLAGRAAAACSVDCVTRLGEHVGVEARVASRAPSTSPLRGSIATKAPGAGCRRRDVRSPAAARPCPPSAGRGRATACSACPARLASARASPRRAAERVDLHAARRRPGRAGSGRSLLEPAWPTRVPCCDAAVARAA